MNILELIEKKKNKQAIDEQEFDFLIKNYLNDTIKDYQVSAFLMALLLNGANLKETVALTKAMVENGEQIKVKPKNKNKLVVDKHSSGGVGDKVTLILSPILVALGFDVAKLSGRGLSFTGGTIDKLESVGANTDINNYQALIDQFYMFNAMQTDTIVPADKKLYALRDVTGTVNAPALIASSIMSKKLAVSSDYIFLDVKVGNGAFCKTLEEAEALSKLMLALAKQFNRHTIIHLTAMQKPLGRAIGNKIEVLEALQFLNDDPKITDDLKTLISTFVIDILTDTKIAKSKKEAQTMYEDVIKSKKAFHILIDYLVHQGANKKQLENLDFFHPKHKLEIKAQKDGYIEYESAKEIGLIAVELGAGRKTKTDTLDFEAGIYLNHKTNDLVKKGDVIATLYADHPIEQALETRFLKNTKFHCTPIEQASIILKKLK